MEKKIGRDSARWLALTVVLVMIASFAAILVTVVKKNLKDSSQRLTLTTTVWTGNAGSKVLLKQVRRSATEAGTPVDNGRNIYYNVVKTVTEIGGGDCSIIVASQKELPGYGLQAPCSLGLHAGSVAYYRPMNLMDGTGTASRMVVISEDEADNLKDLHGFTIVQDWH